MGKRQNLGNRRGSLKKCRIAIWLKQEMFTAERIRGHGKECWIVLEGDKSQHTDEQPGTHVSVISLKE